MSKNDELLVVDPADLAAGKTPPAVKTYVIKIDKEKYGFEGAMITGAQILKIVNKSENEWHVQQKNKGGHRTKIEPNDIVNLEQEGIERFETVQKDVVNG